MNKIGPIAALSLLLAGRVALAVPAPQIAPSIAGPTVAIGQGGTNATTYTGAQASLGLAPGAGLFSDGTILSTPFIQETITASETLGLGDIGYHMDLNAGSAGQVLTLPAMTTIGWGYGAGGVVYNKGVYAWALTPTPPNTIAGLASLTILPGQSCAFGADGVNNFTVEACSPATAQLGLYVSIAGSTNAPTLSACTGGTLSADSTNQRGRITGLTAATSCTITFNTSDPWPYVPSPWVSAGASGAAPYPSAVSQTAVTFSFASLTGTLYYGMQ